MYTALAVLLILTNAGLRSCHPSIYVPAQATCPHWYGSPYVARTIATGAEFAFYRQVAITLGLHHMWSLSTGGYLLWPWIIGETTSWLGLLLQDRIANVTEDIIWGSWFFLALLASQCMLLVPIVAYYVVVHIPSILSDLGGPTTARPGIVDELGQDGAWVVPSVIIKAVLFFVLLYAQDHGEGK